jgi:hypothetical protein
VSYLDLGGIGRGGSNTLSPVFLPACYYHVRAPAGRRLKFELIDQAFGARKSESQAFARSPTIRHGALNVRNAVS